MQCRVNCGACCIAPSIASPLPKMPNGKPAGVRCAHLAEDLRCDIFNSPERPNVCADFKPTEDVCGKTTKEAIWLITALEQATSP